MRTLSTRVGVLGDVHCEDEVLAAALALFRQRSVEAVLCVGDVVDGPGDADRTIRLLREAEVEVVRGNHERWCSSGTMRDLPDATPAAVFTAEQRQWLLDLPQTREYQTPMGALLLCHGMGGDDMATLGSDEAGYALANNGPVQAVLRAKKHDVVLSGHSHRRMVRRLDGVLFINAGTLFRDHGPCVAVLDFEERAVRFHDWKAGALSESTTHALE